MDYTSNHNYSAYFTLDLTNNPRAQNKIRRPCRGRNQTREIREDGEGGRTGIELNGCDVTDTMEASAGAPRRLDGPTGVPTSRRHAEGGRKEGTKKAGRQDSPALLMNWLGCAWDQVFF